MAGKASSPSTRESVTGVAERNDSTVAISGTRFDDETLSGIESFDDALGVLADAGVVIDHASEKLGNGFAILSDKGLLVGVEILLLSWQFNNGDNGEFVSANVVARMPGQKSPAKFVVNDGSTGIRDQLKLYNAKTGKTAGLHVKNGLRRSDYTFVDDNGQTKNATTFYLDTSA